MNKTLRRDGNQNPPVSLRLTATFDKGALQGAFIGLFCRCMINTGTTSILIDGG